MNSPSLIRIGELSRRLGISTDRLRAWERRYGLLQPVRTAGGFRLYSTADERRVRAMQEQMASGLSAAEAAYAVLADDPSALRYGRQQTGELRAQLDEAFATFDAVRSHALLDQSFADFGVDDTMDVVIFPLLHDLGDRWARAEIGVGQEHFASSLLQARLLPLLVASSPSTGPMALLACAPGELHTLALIGFGIALHHRGWRTTYLGADTPIATLREAARRITPAIVVISAAMPTHFADIEHDLRHLAREVPLAVAGAGADEAVAQRVAALHLDAGPITAAANLAATLPR